MNEENTATKAKSLLIIGNYPPPYGGIPTVNKYLAEHLVDRGWEVHVIAGFHQGNLIEKPAPGISVYRPFRSQELLRSLLIMPVAAKALRDFWELCPTLKNLLFCYALYRFAKSVCERNAIRAVLACKVLSAGVIGSMLKHELGIPLITSIWGEGFEQQKLLAMHHKSVRFVADHTDRWLSTSKHCAQSIENYGLEHAIEVQVLYHGIDTLHFTRRDVDTLLLSRLGIKPGLPIVMFCGRLTAEMGLGVLLDSIPLVLKLRPETTFLIVGVPYELASRAYDAARTYPENVKVCENVEYESLPCFYSLATLVVAPSTNDRACLGLSIIEAMSCGKPVIACSVGGTVEVITDSVDGFLVQPNDHSALADSICRVLSNPEAATDIASAGHNKAVAYFDRSVNNLGVERLLNQLLTEKG